MIPPYLGLCSHNTNGLSLVLSDYAFAQASQLCDLRHHACAAAYLDFNRDLLPGHVRQVDKDQTDREREALCGALPGTLVSYCEYCESGCVLSAHDITQAQFPLFFFSSLCQIQRGKERGQVGKPSLIQ